MSPEEQKQLYQQYLQETQPQLYQQYLKETLQDTSTEAPSAWVPDGPRALDENNVPWQVARLPLKAGANMLGLGAAALTGAGEKLTGHDASEIGLPEPRQYLGMADELFGTPDSGLGKVADSLGQAVVPFGQAPTALGLLRNLAGWGAAEGTSRFLLTREMKAEHPALSIAAMLAAGLLGGGGAGYLTNKWDHLPELESSMVKKLLGWDKSGKPLPLGSTNELSVKLGAQDALDAHPQGYDMNMLQSLTGGEVKQNVDSLAADLDSGLGLRAQGLQNTDRLRGDFGDFWNSLTDTGDRRMTAQRLGQALDDWPHILREDVNVPAEVLAYKNIAHQPEIPTRDFIKILEKAFDPAVLTGEKRTPQAQDVLDRLQGRIDAHEASLKSTPTGMYDAGGGEIIRQVPPIKTTINLKEMRTDLERIFKEKDLGGVLKYDDAQVRELEKAVNTGLHEADPVQAAADKAYTEYARKVLDPVDLLMAGMKQADTNEPAGLGVYTLLRQGGNADMDLGKLKPALEYAAAKDPDLMQGLLKEHLRGTMDKLLLGGKEQLGNPADELMKVLGLLSPGGMPETSAARMVDLLTELSGNPSIVEHLKRLQELAPLVDRASLVHGIEHISPGSKEFKNTAPLAATGIAPFWIARHGLNWLQGLRDKEAMANVAELIQNPDNVERFLELAGHDTRLLYDPMIRQALGQGLLGAAMAEKQ